MYDADHHLLPVGRDLRHLQPPVQQQIECHRLGPLFKDQARLRNPARRGAGHQARQGGRFHLLEQGQVANLGYVDSHVLRLHDGSFC